MNLGEQIKRLRVAQNITRVQLAVALNIKYSTLSNYENNVRGPDYATLILIAKYFKVDPNTLLSFDFTNDKQGQNPLLNLFVAEAAKLHEQELIFFIKFLSFIKQK